MPPCCLEPFSSTLSLSVRISTKGFPEGSYIIPLLAVKYVPEWFPGAGFKKFAKKAKADLDRLADLPFYHVKESFKVSEPCLDSLSHRMVC